MDETLFSRWARWAQREELDRLGLPGVYAVAHSSADISGEPFKWRREIIYIGMTNSASGLKGRLRKFDLTLNGKRGHGGADRVRYKHRDYRRTVPRLYVSVAPFRCGVNSSSPTDLRTMGEVAKFEFVCLAVFAERFGCLPEFNNKKASPKYSKALKEK